MNEYIKKRHAGNTPKCEQWLSLRSTIMGHFNFLYSFRYLPRFPQSKYHFYNQGKEGIFFFKAEIDSERILHQKTPLKIVTRQKEKILIECDRGLASGIYEQPTDTVYR